MHFKTSNKTFIIFIRLELETITVGKKRGK